MLYKDLTFSFYIHPTAYIQTTIYTDSYENISLAVFERVFGTNVTTATNAEVKRRILVNLATTKYIH